MRKILDIFGAIFYVVRQMWGVRKIRKMRGRGVDNANVSVKKVCGR